MFSNIASTATTGTAAEFKVPDNEDFLIYEVRGYLAFDDWGSEVTAFAGILDNSNNGNISPRERAYIKASNCKISLINKDSKLPIIDEASGALVLSSILAELGAPPLMYGGPTRPAFIVPHGQVMKMTATLAKGLATIAGATTDYGITLTGVMLSRGSSGQGLRLLVG